MVVKSDGPDDGAASPHLGAALRRAWIGFQMRVDEAMAASGFDRRLPDGRVLRLCRRTPGITISALGRELGMTRQGAGKIVAGLRERGYVTVAPSGTDGREKVVALTDRAVDYLATQQSVVRRIERDLQAEFGADAMAALSRLLSVLAGADDRRLTDYLTDE